MDNKRQLDGTVVQKLQTEPAPKEPLRESFMNRLKTFSVLNWCGKPIDPPTCAQHGWQISDDNILKCTMCKQVLSVDLPSPSKRQPYREASEKLRSRLQTGHTKYCVYQINATPDSVLQLEKLSFPELTDFIRNRVSEFKDIPVKITQSRMNEITEVFEWLREKLEFSESVTVNIFTLVLTGWQCVEDSVKCDYCQRKWSLEISDTEEDSGTDPVAQHQKWCAWKKLDHGWESYLDQLLKEKMSEQEGRKRRRTSDHASVVEGMRAIRQMLSGTP